MFKSRAVKLGAVSAAAVSAAAGTYYWRNYYSTTEALQKGQYQPFEPEVLNPPPSRSSIMERLQRSSADPKYEYDMLVIGGGATGAGVALDAINRGLKVALVEADDFASCTSSRSTKLVHGGVRYLEKAFWNADYEQYKLVKEALHERKMFLDMAPHLAFPLPIMIPLYKWWQLPYYWAGVKCYDLLAGRQNLESSYILTRGQALEAFPMMNEDRLKGAVVYYDGSHNDSRTNVSVALTALDKGADVLNHTRVVGLEKDANGKIIGAKVRDMEQARESEGLSLWAKSDVTPTSEQKKEMQVANAIAKDSDDAVYSIRAKCVVNATGPFSDAIRQMDDGQTKPIVVPSSGVHIVLPGWYAPKHMGLLDPATSDGRVIFFLPWQGSTIAGTTDAPCSIEANPIPSEKDIEFVLREVKHYIDGKVDVRREDVKAAWCGVRPLVMDPKVAAKKDANGEDATQSVVRNHLVNVADSGLVTIAGGKWTTFREMAKETVDTAISTFSLEPNASCKPGELVQVVGAHNWTPLRYIELIQQYKLDPDVAQHLSSNYGTRAFKVAELCSGTSEHRGQRFNPRYPFVDGELLYAIKYEYATTAVDFLARRTRLAFLDCKAAHDALPAVVDVMARELDWSAARRAQEYKSGLEFLKGMGLHD